MKAPRWIYALAMVVVPLLVGGVRMQAHLERKPPPLVAASRMATPSPPPHDPSKKTVAIVLGADITEITDALGPYELFARTGTFNVYAVAPAKRSVALTGGLRVRPQHSFEELDGLLGGAAPDIVVAPNLPNIRSEENRPVVDWVRRSAEKGATSLSWCAGAAVLAEAGLLDGRTATTHWGDIARLERDYPRVTWLRDARWIDHGAVITSAGITSGIDATLRLLVRTEGEDVARRVSTELRYPNFRFAVNPRAEQYLPRAADAVLLLNAAFRPTRDRIGVALHDGVGELDLSAIYDAYAAAGTADVVAVAAASGLVRTEHGLWLEPALVTEHDAEAVERLDRLIVPGHDARSRPLAVVTATSGVVAAEYLQAESRERFSLEPVLEDLARSTDLWTATFAARRLEYRSSTVRLEGPAVPIGTVLAPLGLSLAAALIVALATRALRPRSQSGPLGAPDPRRSISA